MVIYAMLPRHTGWLAAGSEKANNVPPAAPLLTSAAPLTTSAAPLTTSAAPTVESKTWTGYYRQASAAFDHEKYSVAEKALRSAIVEARHSGNNSELVQSLRKLQDVFYVQENFKAGDALDPEIRKLAGSSSGPTAAQSTKPSAGMAEAAQPQDDRIARLALSCHKKGQCDTAVSLLEHSVEISKKIYGVNSVKTADRLEELATLHLALDESAKAQPIMDQVMDIKASLGKTKK
jgi:tetratricopeptide (TPR) repeat protein